jgi:hypothetical protein
MLKIIEQVSSSSSGCVGHLVTRGLSWLLLCWALNGSCVAFVMS